MTSERTNIVLIGMPGAGKSTVGVVLAKMLGMDFLDVDLLIQNQQGRTLQRIIEDEGVEAFLAIESEALQSVDVHNTVIAPGGSCVYSDAGMQHLARIGKMVYLRATLEHIEARLGGLAERGVVMRDGAGTSLRSLYNERTPLYDSYADVTIDVDDCSIMAAAHAIAAAVK